MGDGAVDTKDEPEPAVEGTQEVEVEGEATAPSAEAADSVPAAVDPQPKRTRGHEEGRNISSNNPTRSTPRHVISLRVTWPPIQ